MHDFDPEFGQEPQTDFAVLAHGKTLGKSVVVFFQPPVVGIRRQDPSPVDILRVQGEDQHAHPLCVTLSPPEAVVPPPAGFQADIQNISTTQQNNQIDTSFAWTNTFAIVEWGVGGVSNRVECDFLNGLCLNLSASWVRIRAGVESVEATTTIAAYRLSACIGPGKPRDNNAQRTVLPTLGALADGIESNARPIPPYAKKVYLTGNVAAGQTFVGRVRFYRDGVGAASAFPCGDILFTANEHNSSPIPNGAMFFTVINNSGVICTPYAVFDLSV